MNTPRRPSHTPAPDSRVRQLEELIGRMWREYRTDIAVHKCDSCMVNVDIFKREAEALGIDLRYPAPF
jgi:hypothetical protein